PLTLRSVESQQLAQIETRDQNRCCAVCLKSQKRGGEVVSGVLGAQACALGLNETAVEVKVGKEIVAYLQTGQSFFKPPTREQTQRALEHLREWEPDFALAEATRRYRATPVVHQQAKNLLLNPRY